MHPVRIVIDKSDKRYIKFIRKISILLYYFMLDQKMYMKEEVLYHFYWLKLAFAINRNLLREAFFIIHGSEQR